MARILLVDDDDLVRTSCAAALAGRGHVVLQSANGRDAVSALTRTAVDAVILDLLMPDMDGIETLRDVRRQWPQLPVLMTSGGSRWGGRELLGMALRLGADGVLAKPYTTEQLSKALDEILPRKPRC